MFVFFSNFLLIYLFGDIRVTGVSDGEGGGTEVLAAGGAEVQVGAVVVVDGGLGEHAVVLKLGLADGVAVVGNNDDLSATSAEGSHGLVEAEAVLAGLHDEGDLRVEVIYLRLGLLSHFGFGVFCFGVFLRVIFFSFQKKKR